MLELLKTRLAKAHKSWTIWFNGIMASAAAVLPMAQDNIPQLHDYLPPNLYQYLMVTVVVANILLRFKTTKGLEEK